MYKINKPQSYIAQHGETQPFFYNNFKWSGIYKNAELLCCISEINILLQINYTSIKEKKRNSHSFPDIPSSESQSLCSFPGSGWAVDIEYRGSDPV